MKALQASLYTCTHAGTYAVTVACQDQTEARAIFAQWLRDTHGVSVDESAISFPKRTRTTGDRPLLIAG